MAYQTLSVLPQTFCIHSLDTDSAIPAQVLRSDIYFIGKTAEELSLVVPDDIDVKADDSDPDWRALEVLGPLDLSMVGMMARIGNVLARAKVSIFVVSTFETDFFLVKSKDLATAKQALSKNGYKVQG